jgi:hypothetical protein
MFNNIEPEFYGKREMFDKYFSFVNRKEKINILWYPSAGNDFRDVVHIMHHSMLENIPLQDMFIHTDYMPEWVDLTPGVKYKDRNTKVELADIMELRVNNFGEWNYKTDALFVDFPEMGYKSGKGFLMKLKIKICYTELEVFVLYLFLENHNFLDMLLRQKLLNQEKKITVNVIKVREGTAWGGVRKNRSITKTIIRNLSNLNSEFIIFDKLNCFDNDTDFNIENGNYLHKDFDLNKEYSLIWSMLPASFYRVALKKKQLFQVREQEVLKQICS